MDEVDTSRTQLYQLEEWQRARALNSTIAESHELYQLEEWQRARATASFSEF